MKEPSENWFVRVYRGRIGNPRRPGEAYGYWIVVAGILFALFGSVALLATETLPLTATLFESLLVGGAFLLVIGPVLALLGLVVRLPLQPSATVLASLGGTVSVGSIAWVVVMIPPPFAPDALVVPAAGYLGGIGLIMLAATVIPLATDAYVERDPTALEHPYYELRETDDGWIWQLCERDGTTVATSPEAYRDRNAARTALERMSTRAPMMGIEVTRGD